jgi:hypothetical protein
VTGEAHLRPAVARAEVHLVTHPYRYLVSAAGAAELIEDLCTWHDRMVAHVRRHGAADGCGCDEAEACPRQQAVGLWAQARAELGDAAASLTFLRQHAEAAHHG